MREGSSCTGQVARQVYQGAHSGSRKGSRSSLLPETGSLPLPETGSGSSLLPETGSRSSLLPTEEGRQSLPSSLPPATLDLIVPRRPSKDLNVADFFMSPSFLQMAEPMVDRAADVFCFI